MFKKKYKVKKDARNGYHVLYKRWFWPFWIFYGSAGTKQAAENWIENDKQPPEYY